MFELRFIIFDKATQIKVFDLQGRYSINDDKLEEPVKKVVLL